MDFHFTERFFPLCRHFTSTDNVLPTTIQGSGSPTPPSFHRRKKKTDVQKPRMEISKDTGLRSGLDPTPRIPSHQRTSIQR